MQKSWKKTVFLKKYIFLQGDPLGPSNWGFEKSSELLFSRSPKLTKLVIEHPGRFQERFLCMCNMQFRERKKILPKSECFSINLKRTKKIHSLKLFFPRKIVFGFIDCKIGKQAKNITPTVQKLLLQVRRKWKKETLIEKGFFTRRTSGMIEFSYHKRPLVSQKVWK